jgi:signal peptidase I
VVSGGHDFWKNPGGPTHVLVQSWPHIVNPGPHGIGEAVGNGPRHPVVVPANSFFMMGDNEPDSCDSRYWGPLSRNLVVGKVLLRIWPLDRFALL